ncbi:Thioesterase (fragment) [Cupriavidus taiwanensis]
MIETQCNYFSSLSFPETVVAGLRVARLGTSSVRYEVGLFSGDNEVAAAQGHFIHVYVDRATRRPVPLPARCAKRCCPWQRRARDGRTGIVRGNRR